MKRSLPSLYVRRFKLGLNLTLCFFLLLPNITNANDPSLHWKTIETTNFKIHFDSNLSGVANKTAKLAESIHLKLVKKIKWKPNHKTELILTDATDFSNGSATPFPKNRSTLIIKPAVTASFDYQSWLETLITHEYTHTLHLDKASGAPKVIRNIIGRFPLLFPNVLEPTWFIEGLATYIETDPTKHTGRGQSSQFKMMMRMEVENGMKPISQVNIRNTDWPLNQVYLYGEHFYRFIAEKYGDKKIIEISDEYGNDLLPFFINRNSEKVFNKDLNQLWGEFIRYWTQHYLKQIEKINKQGVVGGRKITFSEFYTQEFAPTTNGLYYVRKNSLEETMLMFRDNQGVTKEISAINSTAKLDWHPQSGLLISQPEVCNNFNIYFDLYRLNEKTTELSRLTNCSRYSDAKWSKDGQSIFSLKSEQSIYALDHLTKDGKLLKNIWKGEDEQVISQFDVSADNQKILFSIKQPNSTRFQLVEYSLASKKLNLLTKGLVNHIFPQYTKRDNQILFSADYNGVYNLYQLDRTTKIANQLTNLVGGAFQVKEKFINEENSENYYYTGYTAKGYDLFELKSTSPVDSFPLSSDGKQNVNIETVNKSMSDNINTNFIARSIDYSPWSSLTPAYWLPFSSGSEEDVEIGVTTSGSDALNVHNYATSVGINVDKNATFGGLSYVYSQYLNLRLERSVEFGTSVNEIASYIKEDEFEIGFHYPLLRIQSQWDLFAGLATTQIEQGFYSDENYSPSSNFKDGTIALGLSFNNSQNFFKSNTNTNGRQVRLVAESSDVLDSDFSGETYTLDWRELIQIKNEHTLAFRFVQGWSTGNANPFRLGGEDSDLFIVNSLELNKRSYALRGYSKGLTQLQGRRMQLANLEYRFPLTRIEKTMMAPPVGLGTISGKIFFDYGSAYQETTKEYFSSAGFELQTTLHLFYHLSLEVRLGYANGLDLGGEKRTYFSIGKSF